MIRLLLILILVAGAPEAGAATAILNAIAGAGEGRTLLIEFRMATVEGWKIEQASLLLHVESGAAAKRVRISTVPEAWSDRDARRGVRSAFRKPARAGWYRAEAVPDGWVRVTLDPKVIEWLAQGRSHGLAIETGKPRFNGLAPVPTQPYLMVTGGR